MNQQMTAREQVESIMLQERMRNLLIDSRIPAKEIKCYGSQIMITTLGKDSAQKWVSLLSNFARVRNMIETTDYNQKNENTVLNPTQHKVWRVWATI